MTESAMQPDEQEGHPPDSPPKRGRHIRRWCFRIVRIGLLVYLGLALVLALLQNRMIFPGAATQGTAAAVVRPSSPGSKLVQLKTAAGDPIVALFGPALFADGRTRPDARACPTLIYFYGNGMCLADCQSEFHNFRRLGLNVIVPEFVGYGMSGGKPGEAGVYATAEAAYDYVTHRPDIDPKKIIAGGWSLGAAAAIDLASKKPVAGLFTLDAFTSMKAEAHHVFPWLPTSLILRVRFDNEDKMLRVRCPTLIIHGTHDELVPFAMANRLVAAAPNAKLYPVAGAMHNTIFEDGGQPLWDQLQRFVDSQR